MLGSPGAGRVCLPIAAAMLFWSLLAGDAWAQANGKPPTATPPPKGSAKEAPAAPAVRPPDVTVMTLLVQTHMAALSHALVTGNFSVLHALGSADFQKLNPPQKLAQSFAQFRAKGIDIRPTILYQPILVGQPVLDTKGLLRLTGYYNTQPQQVNFDMLFQQAGAAWQLYGISVGTQLPSQAGSPKTVPSTDVAASAREAEAAKPAKEPETKGRKKSSR